MADGSIVIDTSVDGSGLKSGLSKLEGIAGTAVKGVSVAIGAISTALSAAGGYAIKVGSDFEAGMSRVASISGASGQELDQLKAKAKEMGASTKFSATESADAFSYMAMAGWKTADMLDGIEGIMNLAAASGENLASVSDIVTDAITAFGLTASDSGHFADVLAAASSNANTNVSMMGETFKYVAPIAGSMGYSIEDTAVAIGLMANAGIKAGQAGTSLRAMLTRLVKPPKDAAEALEALNISASNSDGTMRPLQDVLSELREKFAGLSESEQANYAASIAGQEAMSGLLAIVNASPEDFDKLATAIDNADGSSKRMADTMNDNLQGQITILKSALEGLGIEFYEQIDAPAKEAVKTAIEHIDRLNKALKEGGTSGLAEAIGDVFADIVTEIASATPVIIESAVTLIQSFLTGLQGNLPQISDAIIGIATSFIEGVIQLLPQFLATGGELVLQLAMGIEQNIPSLLEMAAQAIQTLLQGFTDNIPLFLDVAASIIAELVSGLGAALPELLPAALEAVIAFAEGLLNNVDKLIDAALQLIIGLAQGLINALPKLIEKAPEIVQKLVDAIVNNAPKLASAALTIIVELVKGIIANLPKLFESAIEIIGSIASGIIEYKGNLLNSVLQIVKTIWDNITSVDWLQLGKDIISGIGRGIANAAESLARSVKNAAGNALDSVKNFLGIRSPSKVFRDVVGKNMILGITEGIDSQVPTLNRHLIYDIKSMVDDMQAAVAIESYGVARNAIAYNASSANNYNSWSIGGATVNWYGGGSNCDVERIARKINEKTAHNLRGKGVPLLG